MCSENIYCIKLCSGDTHWNQYLLLLLQDPEVSTKALNSVRAGNALKHTKDWHWETSYILKLNKVKHCSRTVFSQLDSSLSQASAKSNHSFSIWWYKPEREITTVTPKTHQFLSICLSYSDHFRENTATKARTALASYRIHLESNTIFCAP